MALSDVIKKRETTAEGAENKKEKVGKSSLLDNVKVIIGIIAVACIALIVLIVQYNKKNNDTLKRIENVKAQIAVNRAEITRLEGLKVKLKEVEKQQEYYASKIPTKDFDEYRLRIEVEKFIEAHSCNMTGDPVVEFSTMSGVNQATITVQMTGDFSDIMRFCRDFVDTEEIRRIDRLSIEGGTKTGGLKTAEVVLVYFSR